MQDDALGEGIPKAQRSRSFYTSRSFARRGRKRSIWHRRPTSSLQLLGSRGNWRQVLGLNT
jgi:hypothetical protein